MLLSSSKHMEERMQESRESASSVLPTSGSRGPCLSHSVPHPQRKSAAYFNIFFVKPLFSALIREDSPAKGDLKSLLIYSC